MAGSQGRRSRATKRGAHIADVIVHKGQVYIVRYKVRSQYHAEAVSIELPDGRRVYRRDDPERFQRLLAEIGAEPVAQLRVAESIQTG